MEIHVPPRFEPRRTSASNRIFSAPGSSAGHSCSPRSLGNQSQGRDTLRGGSGNDKLYGDDDASQVISGNTDALYGDDGNDMLYGSIGNDILAGGTGKDLLSGGAGADAFRFNEYDTGSYQGGLADTITDLDASDRIELSGTASFTISTIQSGYLVHWSDVNGGSHDIAVMGVDPHGHVMLIA